MPSSVVTLIDYSNESAPTVAAGTTEDVVVTVTPFDDLAATTPTGDVIIEWDGGQQYTVPITPTATGTGAGTATTSLVFDPATSGTPLSAGAYKGSYVLSAYYVGGNYPATSPLTGDDYGTLNAASGDAAVTLSTSAWKLVYYAGTVTTPPVTDTSIAFAQQPQDLATGDKLDPAPTVDLYNADGSIDTTSTAAVTVALASGDNGTLGGTTTVNAVAGVATFADVTVKGDGTYSLAAASGTDNAVSHTFAVSAGKLVFLAASHDGTAAEPLSPAVRVKLVDAKGKILTGDDGTVVSLATVGVTGGAALTGNAEPLTGGIATFPDLAAQKPGTYQLQATDGGDAAATSTKFKIDGSHLAFTKQPADTSVNSPVLMTVAFEDAKGKVDATQNTDGISLIPYAAGGGNGPGINVTPATFKAGVVTFDATQTAGILKAGSVYLEAYATGSDGADDPAVTFGKSKVFKILPAT